MEQEQIIRFITGNLDETEAEVVRQWISADETNKKEFIRIKNLYAFASEGRHRIAVDDDFLRVSQQLSTKQPQSPKSLLRKYLQYAAVLAAAVLIGYTASEFSHHFSARNSSEPFNEFFAPEGQISEFKLTDGTKVWLNSGTRIKVPVNFTAKNRVLFMEGEAFFEVKKDRQHPFYINTQDLSVKVMGTSFNVSAYASETNSEITLIEGVLGVKEIRGKRIGLLEPGQQLVFDKVSHKKIKKEIDTTPYEAWRDGKMIFKGQSLAYIAERLERWYNVEISFDKKELSEVSFTGTILKNKPLSQVLEIICLSSPSLKFNIELNPGGKNKVMLYSNKKLME